jgi:hypothetical protein
MGHFAAHSSDRNIPLDYAGLAVGVRTATAAGGTCKGSSCRWRTPAVGRGEEAGSRPMGRGSVAGRVSPGGVCYGVRTALPGDGAGRTDDRRHRTWTRNVEQRTLVLAIGCRTCGCRVWAGGRSPSPRCAAGSRCSTSGPVGDAAGDSCPGGSAIPRHGVPIPWRCSPSRSIWRGRRPCGPGRNGRG